MKKIVIIWISGVGKTYVANTLSKKLDIKVHYYDSICWKENWVEEEEKQVNIEILKIIEQKKWIFEWYINPAWKERLTKADLIIYLDYKWFSAMYWGIQRWWKFRKTNRPELARGCIDSINIRYLKVMYRRYERQEIEKEIIWFEDKILRFSKRKEVNNWLETI